MSIQNRDKLRLVLGKLGTTLPKLLIAFANEQEIKLKPCDEAKNIGYQEAKRLYMVTYPCSICGKDIVITNPKTKTAVGQYMHDAGWAHAECPEPNLPRPTPPKPIPANKSRPNPNPAVVPVHKSNGSQDKILQFLRDQPSVENMLNSNSNKKNSTSS
jgi:hypothetical protein